MTHRLYTFAVLLFWFLCMTWLAATKILPALQQGAPPDYRDEFLAEKKKPPPVAWDLYWNEKPIGTSVSQAFTADGEPSELRSLVQFERLEVREILKEMLGAMSFLAGSILGSDNPQLDMTIATRLRLDWEGELQGFQTSIKAGDSYDLLFLRGQRTDDDRLRVSVFTGDSDDSADSPLAQEFALPTKSRYSDAFSPRSRMTGLWVGQKWTTPVVSPLSTSNTVRLVESFVEKKETITWQDQPLEVFLVVYRYDSGSGSAARKPVGMAWVTDDGLVVRQELPIGNARVRFERTTDARAIELGEVLEGPEFERRLHRIMSPMPR